MATSTIPAARVAVATRVRSIDLARGIIMILMAIDHVRVYSGVPAGGPTPALFLTRWITNFCAPGFVFFAGVSIFLHSQKTGSSGESRRLIVRGGWLILLELTYLRLAWTFNLDYRHYVLAGVIWMLGWCMILMTPLLLLSRWRPGMWVNAIFGIAVIAGHNLVPRLIGSPQALLSGAWGWLWRVLYFGGGIAMGGAAEPNFFVLYSLIPWIGVMSAGYAFGRILQLPGARRDRICYALGLGAIGAFLVLRFFHLYGDRPWQTPAGIPAWIPFLNTTKYPASLQFLLMTLGPLIALLPLLERCFERGRGIFAQWLSVYGRVPLFYYLLHIPLIHAVAVMISLVRTPAATSWLFTNHPVDPGPLPAGYMWSLGLLYLVTACVVALLYLPCRAFADLKARRKSWWVSYL